MTITNYRARRPTVAFLCAQSAKGTIATNFTLGSSCIRVWTRNLRVPAGINSNEPMAWFTTDQTESEESVYNLPEFAEGQFLCMATSESLKLLLRSNWGPFAAGAWTLSTQVNEWFTLAWVEKIGTPNPQRLVRVRDVWVHRLTMICRRENGRVLLLADYGGTRMPNTPLDALGGITLPAAPAAVVDVKQYPMRLATLKRDPLVANVNLPLIDFKLTLDQGLQSEWWYTQEGWDIEKRGKTSVTFSFESVVCDETWAILDANRSGTKEKYKLNLSAEGAAPLVFSATLPKVNVNVEHSGHEEQFTHFKCSGRSTKDKDTGEFVGLALA